MNVLSGVGVLSLHVGDWILGRLFWVLLSLLALALTTSCAYALRRERRGPTDAASQQISARTFAQLLEHHGFDPANALVTYWYLHDAQRRNSPILPSGSLRDDLGMSAEEVEHTLLVLMALLGRKPELDWNRKTPTTVEELLVALQGPTGERALLAA